MRKTLTNSILNEVGDCRMYKISSLYPLLTYLVIKRYANEEKSIRVDEVKHKIEQTFNLDSVDKRTINGHFQRLEQFSQEASYNNCDFFHDEIILDDEGAAKIFHALTREEIMILADAVVFSKVINANYSLEIIKKLYKLIGEEMPLRYKNQVKHKYAHPFISPEIFITLEQISEAIEGKNKIELTYLVYNHEKQPVPHPVKVYEKGIERKLNRRVVSPHEIVWRRDFYYCLCRYEESGEIYFLRIDQMKDVQVLEDEKVKPLAENFDVADYLQKQPHLFGGKLQSVVFHAEKRLITQIIDHFGTDVKMTEKNEEEVKVEVESSYIAMEAWIIQYITGITYIYPDVLRDRIKRKLQQKVSEL